MSNMTIAGLDDLTDDLKKAVGVYPDMAEKSLKKMGNKLKKETVKYTRTVVKQHTGRLIKGYKVGKVKGYGTNMFVEFSGTAPHFHLVENGHQLVNKNGETVGYVQGKHMIATTVASYDSVMNKEMDKMTDKILKECGLK